MYRHYINGFPHIAKSLLKEDHSYKHVTYKGSTHKSTSKLLEDLKLPRWPGDYRYFRMHNDTAEWDKIYFP